MDRRRSGNLIGSSLDGGQSGSTCFRWRQRGRASLCGSGATALQFAIARRPRGTARIAGALLFVLAAFVALASALALLGHVEPSPSRIGIVMLLLAAVVMPWLAERKRRLSAATGSAALRADDAESAVCGYLATIALIGLAINAIWKVSWADSVAAFILLPLIVREGWEAMKGKPCSG